MRSADDAAGQRADSRASRSFGFPGEMSGEKLTHLGEDGSAAMVDVSAKEIVERRAVAGGFIRLGKETLRMVEEDRISKGSVLGVARVAGIQAAKQTPHLIPLCHPLPLDEVAVDFEVTPAGIEIRCRVATKARTGVEMEALTAASVAALTIYDMCKGVDSSMEIGGVRLIEKTKGEG